MTGPERREQLVGVARSVFAEKGYEAATVEEIADRAGVSKPVVYEHFGGKEGMYAVIVDREVTELTARMADAMQSPARARPASTRRWPSSATSRRTRTGSASSSTTPRPAWEPAASGRSSTTSPGGSRSCCCATFKDRGFDKRTVPMYARMLVGAVALVGEWWLDAGKPSREQVAAHVVNLMWNGLKGLEPRPDLRTIAPG